jgi:hypothetical protein
MTRFLFTLLVVPALAHSIGVAGPPVKKPNILMLLADDICDGPMVRRMKTPTRANRWTFLPASM